MRILRLVLSVALVGVSGNCNGDGISNPNIQVLGNNGEGIGNGSATSTPAVGCAGTGFNFTLSCNSQYLAVF